MSDHSNSRDSNYKPENLNKKDEQQTAEPGSASVEQEWTEAPPANEQTHHRFVGEQQQAPPPYDQQPYGQQGSSGQPPYQRPQAYPHQQPPYPGQSFQGQPYQSAPYQGHPYQGQNYQGQPYQGQPGYNPGMQYYPQAGYQAITTNTKSIVSLILGILSLIIPYIGLIIGIIGIIISTLSLKELNRKPENGKGLAVTGLVLSIIGTLIYALLIFIIVLVFIFADSSDVYYY